MKRDDRNRKMVYLASYIIPITRLLCITRTLLHKVILSLDFMYDYIRCYTGYDINMIAVSLYVVILNNITCHAHTHSRTDTQTHTGTHIDTHTPTRARAHTHTHTERERERERATSVVILNNNMIYNK